VLERGGQVPTILMPDEYRVLKVIVVPGLDLTEATVREELSQFGQIEKVRYDTRQDAVWGTVTFKLPQHAELAQNRGHLGRFQLEACRCSAAAGRISDAQEYTVKVVACRRPLRGFGFVQLQCDDNTIAIAATDNAFEVRRVFGGDRFTCAIVELQLDKKNPTQLYIIYIPTWASPTDIKISLPEAVPGCDVRTANVILPRDNVPPDSQVLFNDFQRKLTDTLRSSDITDYDSRIVTPTEKSWSFVAYLKFRDSITARMACDVLDKERFNSAAEDRVLSAAVGREVLWATAAGEKRLATAGVARSGED